MNTRLLKDLRKALNKEITKNALKHYFVEKGLTEDTLVMPNMLADMEHVIPEVYGKVEIRGYADEFDPFTGVAKIGWNLFVLGHKRMFLGRTIHNRVTDLVAGAIPEHVEQAEPERTVKEVLQFIISCLGQSKHGFDRPPEGTQNLTPNSTGLRSLMGADGALGRSFVSLP